MRDPDAQYHKPLPAITSINRPFWDALRRHELSMQKCDGCGLIWYPPSPLCPCCWSRSIAWVKLSGRGRVSSWVVFHQSYFKSFDAEIPYNVVEVELDEGPRILANVVGISNDKIRTGIPVEIVFDDVTDEVTLARFKPR
ncbi:MAG TPA: Zn-ribbon domain-containing OB-fold protein [Candidatus Binataceae bacterium]|nr:Zn-ribbon domain-containing OB-fold protein [Candidatus Binataceae bacterium]